MNMKVYDAVIVDVANYIYRKRSTSGVKDLLKVVINGISEDVRSRVRRNGVLYLLFDPIPPNDMGISKTFQYSGFRKEILPDYKSDRVMDKAVIDCERIVKNYFSFSDSSIVCVYSDRYEADDYVGGIVESIEGSIALLTTDEDWCRYLRRGVDVINDKWDEPFTREDFKRKFQFYPTAAANTLYKAIFGDRSDGITGAVFIKKAKFTCPIKEIARDLIKEVSKNETTLEDFVSKWNSTKYLDIVDEKTSPFKEFYTAFTSVDQKAPILDTLMSNIRVVSSALKGQEWLQYSHPGTEEKVKFDLLHESIFGIPFIKSFGRTK